MDAHQPVRYERPYTPEQFERDMLGLEKKIAQLREVVVKDHEVGVYAYLEMMSIRDAVNRISQDMNQG